MTYAHLLKYTALLLLGCFLLYLAFAYCLSAMGYHRTQKAPGWRIFYALAAAGCLLIGLTTALYAIHSV